MDGPRDYQTKWWKLIKTNIVWYHLYLKSKNSTEELMYWVRQKVCSGFPVTSHGKTGTFCPAQYKQRNKLTDRKICGLQKGREARDTSGPGD